MKVDLDTVGIEFTFDSKLKGSNAVKFYRKLYGCKRNSNYGKYTYLKDGVLSNIKYLKPTRSTIIVSMKDAKTLRNFFKKYNAVFDEKIVVLNEKEAKELGLNFPNEWKKLYEEIKGNENLRVSLDF